MIFGTAGITAVFALQALECHGLSPEKGEVLVTGAAGGVGSFSIALMAALGYDVAAVSGRIDESGGYLRELGAKHGSSARAEAIARPLESERWAGCIDNVGGEMLADPRSAELWLFWLRLECRAAFLRPGQCVIPSLLRGINWKAGH